MLGARANRLPDACAPSPACGGGRGGGAACAVRVASPSLSLPPQAGERTLEPRPLSLYRPSSDAPTITTKAGPRMTFGNYVAGAMLALMLGMHGASAAEPYPSKPIKIVVPYA